MEIFKIVTLSLSGILLFFVGTMRLINPIRTYLKNSGIKLEKDVNLPNEIRGVSSVMLFGGIIILLGFAMGRLLSIGLDGKPNKLIVQGIIFELVLGVANIFCLVTSLV